MGENGLTLTHYTLEDHERRYRSRAQAVAILGDGIRDRLVEHSYTYRVGDEVEVHHRGAWRRGKVTHLRRVTVVAQFERNRQGEMAAKGFHGADLRPRGEGRWVRS